MKTTLAFLLLVISCVSMARSAEEDAPAAIAQKLFDVMKAHDAPAATLLFLPGASLSSIDGTGKTSTISFETFTQHVGAGKKSWLERIWNTKVLESGPIAVVWANYDFYLDGKFSHCGIDSFQMFKTPAGWKIAAISDSRVTDGCEQNPAGVPK